MLLQYYTVSSENIYKSGSGTSSIPALGRQRQADLSEFEASLVYRVNSRTVRAAQKNPISKNKTNKQPIKEIQHGLER